jgi:hypothetical protein
MNLLRVFLAITAMGAVGVAAPPENKGKEKPADRPPARKPATTPKPQPSMKDMAIREARKFDTDYNGQINGIEVMELQAEFRNNPNSRLYMFDDNSNRVLDSKEITNIKFKPRKKPVKKSE